MATVERLAQIDKAIAKAEALRPEVENWERKVKLVHSLPERYAERERVAQELKQQDQVSAAMDKARLVIAQALEDTRAWRARFLDLCGQLDATTTKSANIAAYTALNTHIDTLSQIHKPLFDARAAIKVVAGKNYPNVWRDAGGADPALVGHVFTMAEIAYQHRAYLTRRLHGRVIWLGCQ